MCLSTSKAFVCCVKLFDRTSFRSLDSSSAGSLYIHGNAACVRSTGPFDESKNLTLRPHHPLLPSCLPFGVHILLHLLPPALLLPSFSSFVFSLLLYLT